MQLGADESVPGGKTDSITFRLMITAETRVDFLMHWGTSSHYDDYRDRGTNGENYIIQNEDVKLVIGGVLNPPAFSAPPATKTPEKAEPEVTPEPETKEPEKTEPEVTPEPETKEPEKTETEPAPESSVAQTPESTPETTPESSEPEEESASDKQSADEAKE